MWVYVPVCLCLPNTYAQTKVLKSSNNITILLCAFLTSAQDICRHVFYLIKSHCHQSTLCYILSLLQGFNYKSELFHCVHFLRDILTLKTVLVPAEHFLSLKIWLECHACQHINSQTICFWC